MTTTAAFIVLGVALLVVVLALVTVSAKLAPAPVTIGVLVTVHTCKPDDQSIHGRLVGKYRGQIDLEDASYVTPDGLEPIPGGRAQVLNPSWLQIHDAE